MTYARTVVLVPRRDGQPDRDKVWAWCRAEWSRRHPDWPIFEGHHTAAEGLFNRSAAINRAAALAGDWDVAVIIDSDVLVDPDQMREAVRAALNTGAMAQPFTVRYDLSRLGSERVMAGTTRDWRRMTARTYTDSVSCIIVVPRGLWNATGGFDEAFRGWGFEDNAYACAAVTMSGLPIHRVPGDLFHLWHPTAPEGKRGTPSHARNKARAALYHAAIGDPDAIRRLRSASVEPTDSPTGIPRILHRTVPRETSPEVEAWWAGWMDLHPGWTFRTWRDPLDPADFPLTADAWHRVHHGAQLADLVRLEVLWREGGIYLDSDMAPYRSMDALLPLSAFAAWEDARRVPNAVLGAAPGHPAIRECIDVALERLAAGGEDIPEATGPGVMTTVLPWRADVLLLPPGSFYPFHYREARRARRHDHSAEHPWAFGAHQWAGSWLPEGKRW